MTDETGMSGKTKARKMEVRSKMMTTVTAIAGESRSGMLLRDALELTDKTLQKRKTKRRSARAARKRNR